MKSNRRRAYFFASISPHTNRCLGIEAENRRSVLAKMDHSIATRATATTVVFLATTGGALAFAYTLFMFARALNGIS